MALITSLREQAKNPRRVSVFLDGKFWRGLDKQVVEGLALSEGQSLDPKTLETLEGEETKQKALRRALNLLSYRGRSVAEIRQRLTRADLEPSIVEETIQSLLAYGYLDDREFAKNWTDERLRLKQLGPHRIKYELRLKGIANDLIEVALAEAFPQEMETEKALEAARSRLATYRNVDRATAYRRLSGYLQRKGFSGTVVRETCRTLLVDWP